MVDEEGGEPGDEGVIEDGEEAVAGIAGLFDYSCDGSDTRAIEKDEHHEAESHGTIEVGAPCHEVGLAQTL